jgi:hypothetical protein
MVQVLEVLSFTDKEVGRFGHEGNLVIWSSVLSYFLFLGVVVFF